MDWTYAGEHPTFYDVWIARDMAGDTFFSIPPDGSWDSAWNLFWNNTLARDRYNAHQPFQVFSCWNGATVFTAKPLLERALGFRGPKGGECFQGEPEIFCKELWKAGYGKIAVVPSVNLEYSNERGKDIKALKGFVPQWVAKDGDDPNDTSLKVQWEKDPPKLVKCMPNYQEQTWVPWDQSLA
jgi:alpha-1,3-mannosyltransferase